MRAVGFHRGSSQRSANSHQSDSDFSDLLTPSDEIDLYCRHNDHNLVQVFGPSDDDLQARLDTDQLAEQYRRLIDSFTGPDARLALVVIPDATHLADDLETLVERLLELERLGSEVRCADPERPDPLQSGDELLGLKGRSPSRQRRIREAVMAKASRGEVLGRTPYGYSAGVDGQLKPVPEEAEVVRNIFKWYAGPWYTPGTKPPGNLGLRRIAQRLNDEGIRTRQGHPWTQVAVAGIIRNRTYLGTYTRYGVRIVGSHDPLVDREIFNRAEAVMHARRPIRKGPSEEPFLLSGLLRCGVCGRGLFGLTRRRRWRRKDRTRVEKAYRYYECPSRTPSRERRGATPHPSWRAGDLDEEVRRQVSEWPDQVFEDAARAPREEGTDAAQRERISAVEREFTRMVRNVASGYGVTADLNLPLRELTEARLGGHREGDAESVAELRYDLASKDINAANRALRVVVGRITVMPDTVELEPRIAPVPAS